MNHEKREVVPLGNIQLLQAELGVDDISSTVRILGVYFTYNHHCFYERNFECFVRSINIIDSIFPCAACACSVIDHK